MVNKIPVNTKAEDIKKSPNLDLRGKVGNKVVGILVQKVQGKFGTSALISVEETDGSTYFKEKEKEREEVTIAPGDRVFLSLRTVLSKAFDQIPDNTRVEVIFTGTQEVKNQPNPLDLYDVNILEGE